MKQSFILPQTFHPVIRNWFTETYGNPTSVQAEAWPLIERGENVLAIAPTGSGKTLTAFLSAISRFCHEERKYDAAKLSVLYVSPLKALPSILALTPESLAILLLNPKGRQVLSAVKYLIIDEFMWFLRLRKSK